MLTRFKYSLSVLLHILIDVVFYVLCDSFSPEQVQKSNLLSIFVHLMNKLKVKFKLYSPNYRTWLHFWATAPQSRQGAK